MRLLGISSPSAAQLKALERCFRASLAVPTRPSATMSSSSRCTSARRMSPIDRWPSRGNACSFSTRSTFLQLGDGARGVLLYVPLEYGCERVFLTLKDFGSPLGSRVGPMLARFKISLARSRAPTKSTEGHRPRVTRRCFRARGAPCRSRRLRRPHGRLRRRTSRRRL